MNKPKWKDVFPEPDAMRVSEYRALHDLLADVAEVSHGDADPEAEITEDKRRQMLGALNEVEDWVERIRTELRKLNT